MFIPCSEKQGSAYFEFQYCKKEWDIKKILKKGYSFKEKDSLLVRVDNGKAFFENYGDYLRNPILSKETQELDPYGVNYYTKEQTLAIREQIVNDRPKGFEVFAEWLEKAIREYNGFFFLGI
ncbi:MAG: hypothetical protein IKJ80_03905 [Clostridia bacterium]|nr:hypothetical protein [Clostridia bacterium]